MSKIVISLVRRIWIRLSICGAKRTQRNIVGCNWTRKIFLVSYKNVLITLMLLGRTVWVWTKLSINLRSSSENSYSLNQISCGRSRCPALSIGCLQDWLAESSCARKKMFEAKNVSAQVEVQREIENSMHLLSILYRSLVTWVGQK